MADYPKQRVLPFAFGFFWKLPKFCPNSAQRAPFFAACWRRPEVCAALHVPCRPGSTSTGPSARSAAHARCGTRHCPSRRGVTIATHTGAACASLWLPCSQVRESATSENGLARLARAPGAPRPPPPTFAAWPTPLMPMRRTSDLVAVAPAGRCCRGATERRDGCGFNDGGAPARSTHPCVTPPPPASFLGLLRTQRR